MNELSIHIIFSICFLLLSQVVHAQNMSINKNGAQPDPSAMLDVQSTSQGLLIPRMTTAQRNAISSPANGLMVFQTDGEIGLFFYDSSGGSWNQVLDSAEVAAMIAFAADDSTRITDADGDTKIQVEASNDEDIIRFDMAGTEFFRMDSGRIDVINPNNSVVVGNGSGAELISNASSFQNVVVGNNSLTGVTGRDNVAIGFSTLSSVNSTNARENTAIGMNSMQNLTTGFHNTALGRSSLASMQTGSENTALGRGTLLGNTGGIENTALGNFAGANTSGSSNIFIGHLAGQFYTGDDALFIENSNSSTPLIYGDFANDSVKVHGVLQVDAAGSGDAILVLEADEDNNNEEDNPSLRLLQDGGGTTAFIGLEGTAGTQATYANSNALLLGTDGSEDVQIYSNGIVRMTIEGSGSVGIGTTEPEYDFHIVDSSGNASMRLESESVGDDAYMQFDTELSQYTLENYGVNGKFVISSDNQGVEAIVIDTFGRVGINMSTLGAAFEVQGRAIADTLEVDGEYTFPALDGTSGQVLQTDGNGVVTWESVSSGNTLDAAYDQGGSGAGRTVTADNGALKVAGTDGFMVTGTLTSGANVDETGAGARMFYNPKTAAFRAGRVSGTDWDQSNLGTTSIGLGYDTEASGTNSVSIGNTTTATGNTAIAIGNQTTASNSNSIAIGSGSTTASAIGAVAIGSQSTASGNYSSALGFGVLSRSQGEVAVGVNSTDYTPNSTSSFNAADRVFTVGNGFNLSNRSDALIIYKSGDAYLNGILSLSNGTDTISFPNTDGTSGQVLQTDGSGNVSWSAQNVSPWTVDNDTLNYSGSIDVGKYVRLDRNIIDGSSIPGTQDMGFYQSSFGSWIRLVSNNAPIRFYTNYANGSANGFPALPAQLGIEANGNVGINESSPSYRLDVNGTFSANSINVNDAFTLPTADGTNGQVMQTDGSGNVTWSNPTTDDSTRIRFGNSIVEVESNGDVNLQTDGTSRFEILNNGNTTFYVDTTVLFNIDKQMGSYGSFTDTAFQVADIRIRTNDFRNRSGGYISLSGQDNNNGGPEFARIQWTTLDGNENDGHLSFYTSENGTPKRAITIDNTQEVGIGVYNPAYPLDVRGEAHADSGNFDLLKVGSAFSFPTTDGTLNQVMTTDGSGTLTWASVSGTSDADWTIGAGTVYNQAATIGMGTNSPDPKYRLSVVASGGASSKNASMYVRNAKSGNYRKVGVLTEVTNVGNRSRFGHWTRVVGKIGGISQDTLSSYYSVIRNEEVDDTAYAFYSTFENTTGENYGVYTTGEDYNYFSGNVGIGTSSPTAKLTIGSSGDVATRINSYASALSENSSVILSKSRGSEGSETAVVQNDIIGQINATAHDGTTYNNAAKIVFSVDDTPGTSDMPGRIQFHTTADGSSTTTERMRIDNDGNVGIGTTTPSGTLSINGSIQRKISTLNIGTGNNIHNQAIPNDVDVLRITGPNSTASISGFTATFDGHQIVLFNISGFTITIEHEEASSTPANRIYLHGGADIAVLPYSSITLIYSAADSRWLGIGYY